VVAESASGIVGFGLLDFDGRLALLYVSPDTRFQGVSKAMLAALERYAANAGIRELTLDSTLTARAFYFNCGYASAGESVTCFGRSQGYQMSKRITL
jgi:GNAT superfamily N-acetyltransferase